MVGQRRPRSVLLMLGAFHSLHQCFICVTLSSSLTQKQTRILLFILSPSDHHHLQMESAVVGEVDEDDEEVYYDDVDDYSYYYCNDEDGLPDHMLMDSGLEANRKNIEFFDYECLSLEQAKAIINGTIDSLSSVIKVCCCCLTVFYSSYLFFFSLLRRCLPLRSFC